MLRVKLTKLKQVCATAFLPRIFKDKSLKSKIDKCAIEYLSKASKSSDSNSKDEEHEKQMRIIEQCFGERPPEIEYKEYKDEPKEVVEEKVSSATLYEKNLDIKRKALISKIFGTDPKEEELLQNAKDRATTAKTEEERLAQKIDHIDETPHVEAGVAKVDGFNTTPKILGHDASNLNISELRHDTPTSQGEQINLDELAKRCLGSPVGEIDKMLLSELKNLSRENSQTIKVNIPTNDSAQKYFSQIFERKTKNNTIISDVSNTHLSQVKEGENTSTEARVDCFHPFHLDTIPVFSFDEKDMTYKESIFKREQSGDDIKPLLLEIPAVLDPYDMQAIPFYEYISKEKIILQNIPELDMPPTSKTLRDSEKNAPMNEEVILQRDDLLSNKIKELEDVESEPMTTNTVSTSLIKKNPSLASKELSNLTEADVAKLLEYKDVISKTSEPLENTHSNVASDKCCSDANILLSSTPNEPENFPPDNISQNLSDTDNSAISNAYPSSHSRRSFEIPTGTAISANQNPDEYFGMPRNQFKSFMDNMSKTESILSDTKETNTICDNISNDQKDSNTLLSTDKASDCKVENIETYDTKNTDSKMIENVTSSGENVDLKLPNNIVSDTSSTNTEGNENSIRLSEANISDSISNETTKVSEIISKDGQIKSVKPTDTLSYAPVAADKDTEPIVHCSSAANVSDKDNDSNVECFDSKLNDANVDTNLVSNNIVTEPKISDVKDADTIVNTTKNTETKIVETIFTDKVVTDSLMNNTKVDTEISDNKASQADTKSKECTKEKDTTTSLPNIDDALIKRTGSTGKYVPDPILTANKVNEPKKVENKLSEAKQPKPNFTDNIVNQIGATVTKLTNSLLNHTNATDAKPSGPKANNNPISEAPKTNVTINTKTIESEGNPFISKTTANIKIADMKADSPISQSIAYSTMPKLLNVDEDLKSNNPELPVVDKKGPITQVLIQPVTKQEDISESQSDSTKKDTSICSEDAIPLSMLLKRVRERSRAQLNRSAYMKPAAKPEEANKSPCLTPLDRSKPKTKLNPNPCQPKPKTDSPCKPDPCKRQKKDPCAKFVPFLLDTIIRSDTSINVSGTFTQKFNLFYTQITSYALTNQLTVKTLSQLSHILDFLKIRSKVEETGEDVVCARDFDPWIPIPSWPIPKIEKRKPLVCPKHGCKLPVKHIPSNTDKPCTGMPKKLSPTKIFLTPLI